MMKFAIRNGGAALALIVVSSLGCVGGSPRGPNPNGCDNTSDCDDGFVCNVGVCRQLCNSATDCAPSEECTATGICMTNAEAECAVNDDCDFPPACQERPGRCIGGQCNYGPQPQGTPCEDGDLCTAVTVCNGTGSCVGASLTCDSPPANECLNENTTLRLYATLGECQPNDGQCAYTTIDVSTTDCSAALGACAALDCTGVCNSCESAICMLDGFNAGCRCLPRQDGARCSLPSASSGVCSGSVCRECISSTDCLDYPTTNSVCWSAECLPDGTCEYNVPAPTLQCAPQSCLSGQVTFAKKCGSNGTCPNPIPAADGCGGLKCDGPGCLASCSNTNDCVGSLSCNTATGACEGQLSNGAPCGSNGECQNTCTSLVCTDLAATNGFCDDNQDCDNNVDIHECISNECLRVNASGCSNNTHCSGTCIGGICGDIAGLQEACDDTDDCGMSLTCTEGSCRAEDGEACLIDGDCVNMNCQCASSDCTLSVCSAPAVDCTPCGYADAVGTACAGSLAPGTACGEGMLCDETGDCIEGLSAGEDCTSPYECADGFCECRNSSCTYRRCATVSCAPCGRINGPGTDCSGNLTEGTSCGMGMECDSTGNCDSSPNTDCSTDSDCVHNNCECGDSTCSQTRCGEEGVDCEECLRLNSSATNCSGTVSFGFQGLCSPGFQCDGSGSCD